MPSSPRVSVFREVGLFDDQPCSPPPDFDNLVRTPRKIPHSRWVRDTSINRIDEEDEIGATDSELSAEDFEAATSRFFKSTTMQRAVFMCLATFLVIHLMPLVSLVKSSFISGFDIAARPHHALVGAGRLDKRANSPTDICKRWAMQSAVVNGTFYIYGGEATTSSSQTDNTWSKYLIRQSRPPPRSY